MKSNDLLEIDEFCAYHKIESSFIRSLEQNGLIEIIPLSESGFVDIKQLRQLERFVRLYYDLDINLEGIEAINYLLERIKTLQDKICLLHNKLRFYEAE